MTDDEKLARLTKATEHVLEQDDLSFAAYWLSDVADFFHQYWGDTEPLSTSSEFRQALWHVIKLAKKEAMAEVLTAT